MAQLQITNLTSEELLLQELYVSVGPGKSVVTGRYHDDLHSMPRIQALWKSGSIAVAVVTPLAETDFIGQKILHDGEGAAAIDALAAAERSYHEPLITPSSGQNAPGQEPDFEIIGSTLVLEFTLNTDRAYRIFKIPNYFIGNPSFHVHWTKQKGAAGDNDESGNAVRWRISYTVFPSTTAGGGNINVEVATVEVEDTYDDADTTSRIVHRTANVVATGFVAGYYLGVGIEAITPAGAPLTCEPALISLDLTFDEYINQ